MLSGANVMQLMESKNRRVLTKNKVKLIQYLKPDDVISYLQAEFIITSNDEARLKAIKPEYERSDVLIDHLMKGSEAAFYKFIEALEETGQKHLAELLLKEDPEESTLEKVPGNCSCELPKIPQQIPDLKTNPSTQVLEGK